MILYVVADRCNISKTGGYHFLEKNVIFRSVLNVLLELARMM